MVLHAVGSLKNVSGIQTLLGSVIVRYLIRSEKRHQKADIKQCPNNSASIEKYHTEGKRFLDSGSRQVDLQIRIET
jgi:hypothetical protein